MSAITDLFAGVAVSDLDVSIDWYTRFFERPPDHRVGDEILWEIDEHATLFIEPNAAHAGSGRSRSVSLGFTRCSSVSPPSTSTTKGSRPIRMAFAT
jgi:hypothetical protein